MSVDHSARRDRLRGWLGRLDVDAVLVTRLPNVRYLTGFTGSHAALLVDGRGAVLATDGRYAVQAAQECPDVEVLIDRSVATGLVSRARSGGAGALAVEEHDVTLELHDALVAAADGAALVRLGRAVEELRAVKDDDEVALLREACAISDRALTDLLPALRPGLSERAISRRLEALLLDHGAEAVAFDTIVASGPHSAVPHHRPTGRCVERGDLLKIDFGARHAGYHADCTRTFVVGAPPETWQRDVYDLVRRAQQAGRDALAPDADVADVDRAARQVIEAAGHGRNFPHGLGHGVGLEIHEAPLIGYSAAGRLGARTLVTVEPGVYLEGRGGVRIEDTLLVPDADASRGATAEPLTTATRDLLVLG